MEGTAVVDSWLTDGMEVTAEMLIRHSLSRWLSSHLVTRRVEVSASKEGELDVLVEYELLATRARGRVEVVVR